MKITVGFGSKLCDVDLYGHKAKPTLAEKKSRLEIELQVITYTKSLLEQAEHTGKESVWNTYASVNTLKSHGVYMHQFT